MFEQDYFMRQVKNLIDMLAHRLLGLDHIDYALPENEAECTEADKLYLRLMALLGEGKVCQAEDLLFEQLEPADPRHQELAIAFYQTLNGWTNERLENCDFSREEIEDGLKHFAAMAGLIAFHF